MYIFILLYISRRFKIYFMAFPEYYNRKNRKAYLKKDNQLISENYIVEVKDSIPYFAGTGSYASLFGDQWKEYKKTQLDSYTGHPISANRLNRCLGELKNNLSGKLVLEAGCGAGRFTEILLQQGAHLVSSDLSSAVEVNKENFPLTDKHVIIQADINDMPYADETFDVVICMGVIQHTPNSEETIENLFKLVKKGGSLIIDHYTFNKSLLFRTATLYRLYLRKLPHSKTIPFTQNLVKRYLPLHKKFKGIKFASVLLNRISPVVSYYDGIPELNDKQQEEWALLDTHDSLTDFYKRFRNKKEILKYLQSLGAIDIWCEYGGNGVEARCKKTF